MNLLNLWTVWRHSSRIRTQLDDLKCPVEQTWPLIAEVFRTSSAIFTGPVGAGAVVKFEAEILHKILKRPDGKRILIEHLNDNDANVSAYCMAGLEYFPSVDLPPLSSSLYGRSEIIEWRVGSFFYRMSLGEYAKRIKARRSKEESE